MELKLPAASEILRRHEQCATRASVTQSMVAPFIQGALGYDIFDPLAVTPDTTGATGNADLRYPQARVEYSIRRNGVPRLLIAVYLERRDRDEAGDRLRQCLKQSPACVGAVTDGRHWTWLAMVDDGTAVVHRETDLSAIEPADERIIRQLSETGWNLDAIFEQSRRVRYEDAIAVRMAREIQAPGEDTIRMLVGMVHEGRRTAAVTKNVRAAAAAGLKRAARVACGLEENSPGATENAAGSVSTILRVECEEPDWTAPPGTSQNEVLRHTLDYIAGKTNAYEAFAKNGQMTRKVERLNENTQANPARYWTRDGWFTSTVRRIEQKRRLINTLADELELKMQAVIEMPPRTTGVTSSGLGAPAPQTAQDQEKAETEERPDNAGHANHADPAKPTATDEAG